MAKKKDTNLGPQRPVTPKTVARLVKTCMSSKTPVFLWGPPGIGKSEVISGIAKEQNRRVIDMRMLLLDPTDVKGIPYYDPDTQSMQWAEPGELPEVVSNEDILEQSAEVKRIEDYLTAFTNAAAEKGELVDFDLDAKIRKQLKVVNKRLKQLKHAMEFQDAILFLDELNAAPPSVQAAAYQLVLDRAVGEYKLPDGVDIIAAGNRETDKGVAFRMPSPLANRFTHLDMVVSFDDWQEWAIDNGVNSDVVGYLTGNKHKLHAFDPSSNEKAFATPRSWVKTGGILNQQHKEGLSENEVATLIAGTVGEGMALDFIHHLKFAASLPSAEDVLNGKAKKLAVDEISAKHTLAINLCYTLKEWSDRIENPDFEKYGEDEFHENIDNFVTYCMDNFEKEMTILAMKTAFRQYSLPINHRKMKTFKIFHAELGKYILAS